MAGVIDNLQIEQKAVALGEGPDGGTTTGVYYGQTFVAQGDRMQSLDLFLNAVGPADSDYHVLIVSVSTAGDQVQPMEVIKEVKALVEPFDNDPSLTQVHINLKGVELEEGQTYAFIIDTHTSRDGSVDVMESAFNNNYSPGLLFAIAPTPAGRAARFQRRLV